MNAVIHKISFIRPVRVSRTTENSPAIYHWDGGKVETKSVKWTIEGRPVAKISAVRLAD